MENLNPIVNLVMMALSGAFGAGVVWTTMRLTMNQYKIDFDKSCQDNQLAHAEIIRTNQAAYDKIESDNEIGFAEIKRKQAALRGETNGGKSIFMPRDEFFDRYASCGEFKHRVTNSITEVQARGIQKDKNWIELKYLLIKMAEKQGVAIPEDFGR